MAKIILNLVKKTKKGELIPLNPFYSEESRKNKERKATAFLSIDTELIEDQLFDPQYEKGVKNSLEGLKALGEFLMSPDIKSGDIIRLEFKIVKEEKEVSSRLKAEDFCFEIE